MVRFDKKWFNPLYFILNDLIKDHSIRTILIYGGKSSSKTVSVAQILVKEAYVSKANSIAFRKESTTIKTTLKKSFNTAIETTRMDAAYTKLEFMYRTIKGSEIVLKGLDSEDKAKGIESYKYVLLDELDHFTKNEYDQFQMSLRGIEGQMIIAAWNPVSEKSWVKNDLVDAYEFVDTEYKLPCEHSFVKRSTCGKVVLIKTTYEDNYFIAGSPCGTYGYRDQNLIDEYNSLATRNYNKYRVNVLGEWGVIQTGGEYWKQFNPEKHVKKGVVFEPGPIHVSFDNNVVPYVTISIWQVFGKDIRQIHEIPCKTPDNNAPKAAKKFISWLRSIGFADMVFLYGDPSANARSTVDENSASFFEKVIREFQQAGVRFHNRVGHKAPEVALRATFINEIYETGIDGYNIQISDTCRVSIDDYSTVKEAPDGAMLKVKVKDKETGQSYEPNGHFSDAKAYFIVELLKDIWIKWKAKKGNKVSWGYLP